jgi:hypothetical protein
MGRKCTDDKFFWQMPGRDYRLGQWVEIDLYGRGDLETFTVVGIREKELELKGDWSGGTAPDQVGWYPVDKCKPLIPASEYEWKTIKETENGNNME